jgi:hypothetical protein
VEGNSLMITFRELLCFMMAAIGMGLVAYPANYVYLVAQFGGTATQVTWLGLGLVALAVYIYQKRPKFLEKVIA